jgi:peptide/nickel transport system permease protein
MLAALIRKLASAATVMLLVATIVFIISRVIPGDPAGVMLGAAATPEDVAQLRARFGLDRPLLEQYLVWLGQLVRLDLGESVFLGQTVLEALGQRAPLTITLCVFALLIATSVGIPLGVIAAVRRGGWVDRIGMSAAFLGASLPTFWVALLLIQIFAVRLGLFPVSGWGPPEASFLERLRYLALPAVATSLSSTILILRTTRTSMLEVLSQDYVRLARSKGLGPFRVIVKHALRNALVPIITVIGLIVALKIGNTIVTETVFGLPGIGNLVVGAVLRRDYPVIQGTLMVISGVYVLVNLIVDVVYRLVDPRIRVGVE